MDTKTKILGEPAWVLGVVIFVVVLLVGLVATAKVGSTKIAESKTVQEAADRTTSTVPVETKVVTETAESRSEQERPEPLNRVWEYQLQQDLDSPSVSKGTTLRKALVIQENNREAPLKPEVGWFSLEQGERTVVGWQGSILGQVHTPQWAVFQENILALNGTAKAYTPELSGRDLQYDLANVSERDRKLRERFGEIEEQDISSEFNRRTDEAETDEELEALLTWREEQYQAALQKIAREFGITYAEASDIYDKTDRAFLEAGSALIEKRGEILSPEEIIRLVKQQPLPKE